MIHLDPEAREAFAAFLEARKEYCAANVVRERGEYIRRETTDHIDRFFGHPRAGDLTRWFPTAKEVTETVGAFMAITRHLRHLARGDRSVAAVVVGDGHSPRTGAYIAISTAWRVISVDPVMRQRKHDVDRLETRSDRIEQTPTIDAEGGRVVIVAVHSHALLNDAVRKVHNAASVDVVSIQCCVPQVINRTDGSAVAPDVEYADEAILSPERRVLVWRNVLKRMVAA